MRTSIQSYPCLSVDNVPFFFSDWLPDLLFALHFQWFEYYMHLLVFIMYLFCMVFSKLLGSIVWCLSFIFENAQPLYLQMFLLPRPVPPLLLRCLSLCVILSGIVPQLLDPCCCLSCFVFSLCDSGWVVSFDTHSSSSVHFLAVWRNI